MFEVATTSRDPETVAFWGRELREKCILWLTKARTTVQVTSDETALDLATPRGPEGPRRGQPGGGKRKRSRSLPPIPRKERKARPDAVPKPGPKKGAKDRKGELCNNYNNGTCNGKCPFGRTHKCSKCGGQHPATECKQ